VYFVTKICNENQSKCSRLVYLVFSLLLPSSPSLCFFVFSLFQTWYQSLNRPTPCLLDPPKSPFSSTRCPAPNHDITQTLPLLYIPIKLSIHLPNLPLHNSETLLCVILSDTLATPAHPARPALSPSLLRPLISVECYTFKPLNLYMLIP
jgi:hypothetical protein